MSNSKLAFCVRSTEWLANLYPRLARGFVCLKRLSPHGEFTNSLPKIAPSHLSRCLLSYKINWNLSCFSSSLIWSNPLGLELSLLKLGNIFSELFIIDLRWFFLNEIYFAFSLFFKFEPPRNGKLRINFWAIYPALMKLGLTEWESGVVTFAFSSQNWLMHYIFHEYLKVSSLLMWSFSDLVLNNNIAYLELK